MSHSNKAKREPLTKIAIIVDIDGTLADCEHRRHLVQTLNNTDKNWAAFTAPEIVEKDTLIEPVATVLKAIYDGHTALDVFYVSGRDAHAWEVTKKWLEFHGLWFADHSTQLWCRGIGDTCCDTEFKKECLDKIRMTHNILCAIDDRVKVVNMWRANGVTCLQPAHNDF